MDMKIFLMILGMSIVTYIPRAIPAVALDKIRISPRTQRFLSALPYAALGSLIFPGILSVEQGNPLVGLAGGVIAVILSCFRLNITFVICGSVLTVFIIKIFG